MARIHPSAVISRAGARPLKPPGSFDGFLASSGLSANDPTAAIDAAQESDRMKSPALTFSGEWHRVAQPVSGKAIRPS